MLLRPARRRQSAESFRLLGPNSLQGIAGTYKDALGVDALAPLAEKTIGRALPIARITEAARAALRELRAGRAAEPAEGLGSKSLGGAGFRFGGFFLAIFRLRIRLERAQ